MRYINQLFFATVITTMTGTITFGLWRCLQRFFLKWNPSLVYQTLRLVCLMYIFPVGYMAVQLTVTDSYLQPDGIWQMHFHTTGGMNGIVWIAEIIWIVLTVQGIAACLKQNIRWRKMCHSNIPVEDETILLEFSRIRKKLGLKRRIGLYYNTRVAGPMITGVIHSSVLLPKKSYTTEQLTVIFYHELTHYKNHDLLFKSCTMFIRVVQHLNACANSLFSMLNEWSECYCDTKAVEAMHGEMTPKRYFEIIIDIVGNTAEVQRDDYIFSMLYENQRCLERRIDYMGKYIKVNSTAKRAAFAVVFGFALMGMSTAYAAGSGMVEAHDAVYKGTEEVMSEGAASVLEEEVYLQAAEDDSYGKIVYAYPELEEIMPMLDANEAVNFTWSVSPDTRHISNRIYVNKGQTISVSASATPGGKTYWIGIMNTDGDVRYVEGSGSLAHNFSISESDYYRVLVQNRSTTTISANGSYYYY